MEATGTVGDVFVGQGEMADLCRTFDWAATPLGPVSSWSQSLRTTVSTLLCCRNPMFLFWGPELVQFYNDAYRPSLGNGGRHPIALGAQGRHFWTDIWETIGPQIDGVMTRGHAVWFEDQFLPIERNGRLEDVWWTYSYSPVRDDDGGIGGTLVVCLETTARVMAERRLQGLNGELELERSRLAHAFQETPAFFALYGGPAHRFEFVNDSLYQLIGRRDVIGKSFIEALPEVAGQGFKELLDGVLNTGEPFVAREIAVTLQRTPGAPPEERFVDLVYKAMVETDGTRSGVLAHGHDVTDHVRARRDAERAATQLNELETQFRAVQDASPDASLLARSVRDDDGRIVDFLFTYSNTATETILLGRRENLVGRTMREAFPESVAAGRLERYVRVVETGEHWLEDVEYTRGSVAHGLRVSAVKVGDGVHIAAADLSERIRAAAEREELLQTAKNALGEAERANRAKSDFLAVMSHELRTPLNAIDGYAELLEMGVRGPISEQQLQDLARIRKSQRHLLGLINGVLNYARVEAGAVQFNLESVSVPDILATCEALTAPQMKAKGLAFTVVECVPVVNVRTDGEKIQQILINLLTNALKFTETGGSVRLSCTPADDAVAISITDTGCGIPTDQLERVFAPFVQVDARLTRTQDGVGLGLAISRDLARGMGGEITVRSTPGTGSTFTLTLPRG